MMATKNQALEICLRDLKLSSILEEYGRQAIAAEKNNWSYPQYLLSLASIEGDARRNAKINRNRLASKLPATKTKANLDLDMFSTPLRKRFADLCTGKFIDKAENILAFGLPGVGKSHYLCAIGHELVSIGYRVYFAPAFKLVEHLLSAQKELLFEKTLKKLDSYDVILIDDIGYIKQNRHQMEVLFSLLSERYERKSVMISSNLVFSKWDQIFLDPMTTAAAIDRLIHHAQVLEFKNDSYRAKTAKSRLKTKGNLERS